MWVERDTVAPQAPVLTILPNDAGKSISLKIQGEANTFVNITGTNLPNGNSFRLDDTGERIIQMITPSDYEYLTTYTYNVKLEDRARNLSPQSTVSHTTPAPPTRQSACQATTAGKISYPFSGSYPIPEGGRFTDTRNFNGTTVSHGGTDFSMDVGTEILASHGGTISRAVDQFGGMYIDVTSGNTKTRYLHLSKFLVPNGVTVAQGQLIGYSGNTGYTTGPHLHFEVYINGTKVDPLGELEDCSAAVVPPVVNDNNASNVIVDGSSYEVLPELESLAFQLNAKDDLIDAYSVTGQLSNIMKADFDYWVQPIINCFSSNNFCSPSQILDYIKRIINYFEQYLNGIGEGISQSVQEIIKQLWDLTTQIFTDPLGIFTSIKDAVISLWNILKSPDQLLKILSEAGQDFLTQLESTDTLGRARIMGKIVGQLLVTVGSTLIGGGIAATLGKIATKLLVVTGASTKIIKLTSLVGRTIKIGKNKLNVTIKNLAGGPGIDGKDAARLANKLDDDDFGKYLNSISDNSKKDRLTKFRNQLKNCSVIVAKGESRSNPFLELFIPITASASSCNLPDDVAEKIAKKNGNLSEVLNYTTRDGKHIWLENGNGNNGWYHIDSKIRAGGLTRSQEIINTGIASSSSDVKQLIFNTVNYGNKSGNDFTKAFVGSNGVTRNLKVVVGNNGYIVTVTFI
jgi:murein DD-endopeptidase MepM/ murein hydrolase activator NlpD